MSSTVTAFEGLYTLDEFRELIEPTEALEERLFEMTNNSVKFSYTENDDRPPRVVIGGDVFELTSESYLGACHIIGLGRSYAERTPVELIIPHLNYWFSTIGGQRKALIRDRKVVAFMLAGTEIYSTVEIMNRIVNKAQELGEDSVYFDKVHHDINETQFSVIFPNQYVDLNDGSRLYGGLQFQNSILGQKPLIISGYVHHRFADVNGGSCSVITTGQWDRKLGTSAAEIKEFLENDLSLNEGDFYSVYDWVEQATYDVYNRLNKEFSNVQQLAQIPVGSHAGTFFQDVFKKFKIPVSLRKAVQEEYADRDGNTVLDLWAAVSSCAGRHEVRGNPSAMRHIMLVAGELAAHPDRCPNCHRLVDV